VFVLHKINFTWEWNNVHSQRWSDFLVLLFKV